MLRHRRWGSRLFAITYNTGDSLGVKQGIVTIHGNLLRASSYDSYLKLVIDQPCLDVLYYAPMQSIVWDESRKEGEKPRAGVHRVWAAKDAIVSLSAFQLPQL